jgi:hypothetical protein
MGWQCIEAEAERAEEERTFYNVVPDYGPKHDLHPDCWCEPEIDHEFDSIVVHREVQ